MPLVRVNNWGLPEQTLEALVTSLPEIVADALSGQLMTDSALSMNDIEVVVHRGDPLDIHGGADFGINIEVMHFPEREAKLPRAKLEIKKAVLEIVEGHTGYVWITLPPADFVEIHSTDTVGEVEQELLSLGE